MKLGLQFYITEDTFGINVGNWYKKLFYVKPDYDRDMWHAFGFSYSDRALHLRWGHHTKIFWMPHDFGSNLRHEVQNEKGSFVPASCVLEGIARKALLKHGVDRNLLFGLKIPDSRKMYKSTYTYKLRDGTTQERTATYYVEEREWRWRIFHPFAIGPKKLSRSISIEFDAEVGEGTGSWKGGCTGCSYQMLPGEKPEDTLRRMERERKFSR